MGIRPDISAGLLEVTREINEPRELQATLDIIVETAARSLPGIDHVGITIAGRNGQMETQAARTPSCGSSTSCSTSSARARASTWSPSNQ